MIIPAIVALPLAILLALPCLALVWKNLTHR
jgi:hypothetical protein